METLLTRKDEKVLWCSEGGRYGDASGWMQWMAADFSHCNTADTLVETYDVLRRSSLTLTIPLPH